MVAGIPDQRVRLAETPFFTARERAALALTEAGTRLDEGPVSDGVYAGAAEHFSETELAGLILGDRRDQHLEPAWRPCPPLAAGIGTEPR